MNKRLTMKDIAAEAGTSASTVCRALAGNHQIPKSTRERIRAIAQSMGYKPDPLLSAFASRRRGKTEGSEVTTIAYVTKFHTAQGWMENVFYRRCYEGAQARAESFGYRVEHFWLKERGMTNKRFSRILYNRGITAVCIAPTPAVRGHLSLDWDLFSSVTLGYSLLRPNLHRTSTHHFHTILLAVRELKRRGYKRMGFCVFEATSKRVDNLWLAGILLSQQLMPGIRLEYFLFNDRSRSQIPKWCRQHKLEVVIGGEPAVLHELQRSHLFPDKVDYVTTDWIEAEKEIAGIDQRPDKLGAAAVDLLIAQIQRGERGIPEVPVTTLIEGEWIDGDSVQRKLVQK